MFKTGDVVALKSGGPAMVVVYCAQDDFFASLEMGQEFVAGDVMAQWFDGKELKVEPFKKDNLRMLASKGQ